MSAEETNMQDEQNIPLLKDVVDPDEIEYTEYKSLVAHKDVPDSREIIEIMRKEITTQLNQELQPLITAAINTAVDQATGTIRQIMLDELQRSLQNRLRMLIEEKFDKQFGQ